MRVDDAVKRYIVWKRSDGCIFERGATTLQRFSRSAGEIQLSEVMPDHVLGFLNGTPISNATWRLRYWVLYRFFEHWVNREILAQFTLPPPKYKKEQLFSPHIFTSADLRLLLKTAGQAKRRNASLHPYILRIIFLFLYATGSSIGELCNLRVEDFDSLRSTLQFRGVYARRFRVIPIGPALCEELQHYKEWRSHLSFTSPHFFFTKKGNQVTSEAITKAFKSIRRLSGIRRSDGLYRPRLSDLRFTFAVNRITKWIEMGADMNRMLPALAAYMGQSGLGATPRYLSLTPERFRKDLDKLNRSPGKSHWSDDSELMSFLISLSIHAET